MSEISVTTRRGDPVDTEADTRIVGLFEGESLEDRGLQRLVDAGEAKGALKKVAVTHEEVGSSLRRVIVAGLGRREELDAEKARVAAAAATARASELGSRSLSWTIPDTDGVVAPLVEGTLLKLYRFDRYKSKSEGESDSPPSEVASLELVSERIPEGVDIEGEAERARVVSVAANAARDLQNLPANVATPSYLAERARALADAHESLSIETFDRAGIESLGMGAFASVAQGTYEEPQLIVLRYAGAGEEARSRHLGFVGKAVTFDTGGISIKPSAKMQEMKFDMSGGAAVLEAMRAIAELELPVRITAIVPATENMPSGRSVKPGDIVTAMNGKTIEVNNTDAEGRLLLADALAYAVDQGCERIVDLATLTGAIIIALGSTYAGLFSNDDRWYGKVESACSQTGEIGWRLPLHPEFLELTRGAFADLTNASDQRKASSSYAAEFLRQFVGETPWVHVDIAGVAWGGTREYVGSGASGWGVRMLVELARGAVR
ncbi:MAG: Cytosol aminopeptidase PepA [uncultured Solirubrobacterales bacterium]|uniref:Probable cytosol aminopeptidase n=1 Tax=uncultured Solirubrobacterales bacterium TaxID=768556 RepID=A0A6J4SI35_9ACTN|nr:MAG: Cytosol aminopeptidase PepA [uncultured Solirubrobacterales bacterium]